MLADRPQKDQIFNAAAELRNHAERAEYLEVACGKDPKLRAEIEELLQHDMEAGSFLESPAPGLVATALVSPVTEAVGTMVGRYKLREQIGEGGMGIVYVAEQLEPVRRKVALKIIKPGMDTKQVIARFEAERQALALMDHLNIARVLDAGATDSGRPYFVMELVRGVPITEFCDQARLNARQRLELFVQVCQAAQHAHHKGIIHRDLKPSNVLVTMHDDKAVPKVIDFGVAKAAQQRLTEQTLYTQFSQMVGTPLYMSPEQAQMSGLDVDTRTDVYSLGVLLYELLTGTTPFDQEALTSKGFDEMRRIIREDEPPRPSHRLSTLDAAAQSTLQRRRGIDSRQLSQSLKRELDWIVMKALEKDRTRRYESASALAQDIQRFLDDEPVEACPPSAWYRLGKFGRRHRGWVSAGAILLVVILTAGGLFWNERSSTIAALMQETHQRQQAVRNLSLANEVTDDLFVLATDRWRLHDMTSRVSKKQAVDRLLRSYEQLTSQFSDEPGVRQSQGLALNRLSDLYGHLGQAKLQQEVRQRALALFKELAREFPEEPAYALNVASAYLQIGSADNCARAVTVLRQLVRSDGVAPSGAEDELADHYHSVSYLEWTCNCFGQHRFLLAYALERLANELGEAAKAEPHLREAVALWTALAAEFPEEQRHLLGVGNSAKRLGTMLEATDCFSEAGPLYAESEKYLRRALELNATSAVALHSLASFLSHLDRHGEATTERRKLMDLFTDDPQLRREYWAEYWKEHQVQRDGNQYLALLERDRALWPEDPAWQINLARYLATCPDDRLRDPVRAIRLASQVVEQDPNNADLWSALSVASGALEDWDAATAAAEQAVRLAARPTWRHNLSLLLANCPDHALRDVPRALQLAEAIVTEAPTEGAYWSVLGQAHYRSGDWAGAIAALTKAGELAYERKDRNDFFLAMAHWQAGEQEQARKLYEGADAWMRSHYSLGAGLPQSYFRSEAAALLGVAKDQSVPSAILYGGVARNTAYSTLAPGILVGIDPSDGMLRTLSNVSPRPDLDVGISGLAFNSKGVLFASCSSNEDGTREDPVPPTLIRIDRETGALFEILGVIRTADGELVKISDLAIQPGTDVLFGIGSVGGGGHGNSSTASTARLFTIDTRTVIASLVGDTGLEFGGGLAFAADGTLYQTSFQGPIRDKTQRTVGIFTVDPKTGKQLSFVVLNDAKGNPTYRYNFPGLAVRPQDGLLFATGSIQMVDDREPRFDPIGNLLVTIDPANGFVSPIGPNGGGIGAKMGDIAFWEPAGRATVEP